MKCLNRGGLLAVIAVVLLGCTPAPTQAPTTRPSPNLEGDPQLAATLPSQLGGSSIAVISMRGSEFAEMAAADPDLLEYIERLGVGIEDVSVAFGFSAEPPADLLAFRAVGVDDRRLVREFQAVNDKSASDPEWQAAEIGGKQVVLTSVPDDPQGSLLYLYARADTLYVVATPDRAVAEQALMALP